MGTEPTNNVIRYDEHGFFDPARELPRLTGILLDRLEKASSDPTRWLCTNVSVDFGREEDGSQQDASYDNPDARLRYTLQYAYSYGYEYYLMYRDILLNMAEDRCVPNVLGVTSFGCGNGVDYWGLNCALANTHETIASAQGRSYLPVNWHGIDKFDWSDCRFPITDMHAKSFWGNPPSGYRTVDVTDYVKSGQARKDGALSSDIYIFPKSTLELESSLPALKAFFGRVAETTDRDRIYIAFAPPHATDAEDEQSDEGIWRKGGHIMNFIVAAIRELYETFDISFARTADKFEDDLPIIEHVKKYETGWPAAIPGGDPECAVAFRSLATLSNLCPAKGRCRNPNCPVDRYPMTRSRYLSYRIWALERREHPRG